MTTLEKIEQFAPELEQRTEAVQLLIEAKAEIERLEKENTLLKSALIEIRDMCQRTGYSFEDQSFAMTRIATEALHEGKE